MKAVIRLIDYSCKLRAIPLTAADIYGSFHPSF
jgi:hypothetical protein